MTEYYVPCCPQCAHYQQLATRADARRSTTYDLYKTYYDANRANMKGIKRLHRKIAALERELSALRSQPTPEEVREMCADIAANEVTGTCAAKAIRALDLNAKEKNDG